MQLRESWFVLPADQKQLAIVDAQRRQVVRQRAFACSDHSYPSIATVSPFKSGWHLHLLVTQEHTANPSAPPVLLFVPSKRLVFAGLCSHEEADG